MASILHPINFFLENGIAPNHELKFRIPESDIDISRIVGFLFSLETITPEQNSKTLSIGLVM